MKSWRTGSPQCSSPPAAGYRNPRRDARRCASRPPGRGECQHGHVQAHLHTGVENRVVVDDVGGDWLRSQRRGNRVGHQTRIVAAMLDQARRPSVRTRVSLMPPSCTVPPGALPPGANLTGLRPPGRRHAG